MKNNRAIYEMYLTAVEMLKDKDPLEIAKNAGVIYHQEKKIFVVPSLGQEYEITYPNYYCNQEIDSWQYLVLLHYLNLADGTMLSGKNCNFGQMPEGVVRGSKFDQTMTKELCNFLKGKREKETADFFVNMGGIFEKTAADMTVRLPFLPRFPLIINIWFADDEFPPSARMLVDEAAGHYLTVEDAVTAGEFIIRLLNAKC